MRGVELVDIAGVELVDIAHALREKKPVDVKIIDKDVIQRAFIRSIVVKEQDDELIVEQFYPLKDDKRGKQTITIRDCEDIQWIKPSTASALDVKPWNLVTTYTEPSHPEDVSIQETAIQEIVLDQIDECFRVMVGFRHMPTGREISTSWRWVLLCCYIEVAGLSQERAAQRLGYSPAISTAAMREMRMASRSYKSTGSMKTENAITYQNFLNLVQRVVVQRVDESLKETHRRKRKVSGIQLLP